MRKMHDGNYNWPRGVQRSYEERVEGFLWQGALLDIVGGFACGRANKQLLRVIQPGLVPGKFWRWCKEG